VAPVVVAPVLVVAAVVKDLRWPFQ